MCTPTKGGARRRRGSCVPGMPKPAELPLGLDVINSLPPLCFPGKTFPLVDIHCNSVSYCVRPLSHSQAIKVHQNVQSWTKRTICCKHHWIALSWHILKSSSLSSSSWLRICKLPLAGKPVLSGISKNGIKSFPALSKISFEFITCLFPKIDRNSLGSLKLCYLTVIKFCSFCTQSALIFAVDFVDGGLVCKKRKPVSCHSLVLTDIEGRLFLTLKFTSKCLIFFHFQLFKNERKVK